MMHIIKTTAIFVSALLLGISCRAGEAGNESMDTEKELTVVAHRGGAALGLIGTQAQIEESLQHGGFYGIVGNADTHTISLLFDRCGTVCLELIY